MLLPPLPFDTPDHGAGLAQQARRGIDRKAGRGRGRGRAR